MIGRVNLFKFQTTNYNNNKRNFIKKSKLKSNYKLRQNSDCNLLKQNSEEFKYLKNKICELEICYIEAAYGIKFTPEQKKDLIKKMNK